jgi:hypothetical protein
MEVNASQETNNELFLFVKLKPSKPKEVPARIISII